MSLKFMRYASVRSHRTYESIIFLSEISFFPSVHAANERNIFSLKKNGTAPNYILDGMTNDIDGNLSIAVYGANKVMKINPKYIKKHIT